MRPLVLSLLLLFVTQAFGAPPQDPYPGSGGLILGTPSDADVRSGRSVFAPNKFAQFQVGTTTKQQVVDRLGPPANWDTADDGTSELGYDFVSPNEMFGMRKVLRAAFTFDKNLVLSKMDIPEAGE